MLSLCKPVLSLSQLLLPACSRIPVSYVTMPLDTIKTRMQSIEAKTEYKNTFHCAARMFREEKLTAFWAGATPRLVRLILSGGIVFTMYVSFTWLGS